MSYEQDKLIYQKLIALLENTLQEDKALRARFKIEDDYSFLPQQLQSMLDSARQELDKLEQSILDNTPKEKTPGTDEMLVYVYLYHDQGRQLRRWENMLLPEALLDYSVNRPIYAKESQIEKLVQSRDVPENHAYLSVIVDKNNVIEQIDKTFGVDPLGQPLVRVREGALRFDNIMTFHHGNKIYTVLRHGKFQEKKT